jgi:methionine synthase
MELYDETAESMSSQFAEFMTEGLVNVIGDSCRTTDELVRCCAEQVKGKRPHQPMKRPNGL